MAKATHNGTCQVCGACQAFNAKTGVIAKHGYTVDYGFFNGVCPGADSKPLQHDRSIADAVGKRLRQSAEDILARAGRIESGAEAIETLMIRVREGWRSVPKPMTRDQADALGHGPAWDRQAREYPDQLRWSAKHQRRMAEDIAQRADSLHGTDLLVRETQQPQSEKYEFESIRDAYKASQEYRKKGHRTMVRGGRRIGQSATLYVYPPKAV